jgi:hypothetical protein
MITFVVSVLLAALGFIFKVISVSALTPWAFWLVFAGMVLLVLALLVKGL